MHELLQIRIGQIEGLIEDAREFGYKVYYGEEEIVLNEEHLLKGLEVFENEDYIILKQMRFQNRLKSD